MIEKLAQKQGNKSSIESTSSASSLVENIGKKIRAYVDGTIKTKLFDPIRKDFLEYWPVIFN